MIILKKVPTVYPRRNVTCIAFMATASLVTTMLMSGIPIKRHPLEPWQYVSPEYAFTKGRLWELLQDSRFKYIAVVTFLVSPTGSNQTFNIPGDWNSGSNKVEPIGAGASGGAGNGGNLLIGVASGGGAGAYSAQTNIVFTPGGTATYQIGTGGTAVSQSNFGSVNGNAGGDSWFNGATLGASSVGAKGGGPGQGNAGGNPTIATAALGGSAASGIGATKNSGGSSGSSTGTVHANCGGSGGGGAAGPNGNGNSSSNSSDNNTAGGSGDAGSGGVGGVGGGNNPGGNGTEFDATHGSGGGGAGNGSGVGGATAGSGGNYGGGGGGSASGPAGTNTSGAGIQGIIVVTNIPSTRAIFAGVIG